MVESNFSGKVVVVTNAAQGIGLKIARCFEKAGARVILTTSEAESSAPAVALLPTEPTDAFFELLDVRVPSQSNALVERVVAKHKRIDVWVNVPNLVYSAAAEAISTIKWDESIAVLLSGTFYCCQAAGRQMLAQGHGVIVNLVSVNGLKVIEGHAANATAEAGVMMLTQALGVEWSKHGVRVLGIATGPTESDLPQKFTPMGQFAVEPTQRVPLHRLGTSQEIADAVLFLAGNQANFITAETLRVDGGWTAYQLF